MQTQGGFRSLRIGAGCLLGALALTVVVTKLLSIFKLTQSKDTLLIIDIACFSLFILLSIAWTILGSLSKVRFGLGKMLGVVWGGAASMTCIVASPRAEIISFGIFGLVILAAYLIAGVARSNIDTNEG